jgi:hypothetical protein
MSVRRRVASHSVAVLVVALGAGCASADTPVAEQPVPVAERCVVSLHGKGGEGRPATLDDKGTARINPVGNAEGWGGRQWIYFPDDRYDEALGVVTEAVTASQCQQVVLSGFSNGAAFVAAMWCRGETLDGRLRRVVIDDPVPDQATADCAPPPDVPATLYWTGGLADQAVAGQDCESIDWTCAGGSMVGIDAYAEALGVEVTPSVHSDHQPYTDAPELRF